MSSEEEDVGVNCCQELLGEELIIENIIQEEIMESVKERELSYSDYLALIESEEKAIADLDNDIETVESELENINIAIDLAEAERLNQVRLLYGEVVSRRKDKEAQLEKLEIELEGRRDYLNSLREDDEIDKEADAREDRDSLTSSMDTHIEKDYSPDVIEAVEFMEGEEPTVSSVDGIYTISDTNYVVGTDGEVLF